jgi:hypothetical protein
MANRFWVGGTGTWDASDTTHWAATSNGAGGQSVPGSSDTATFDASSGGGTVTVNHATLNIQSLTMGAFTGTLDFATNDNNITLNGTSGFQGTGAGVRTLNMGDGTWTISNATGPWDCTTVSNFTFNANGSTILFTGTGTGPRSFTGGGLTYNNLTVNANASYGLFIITGANTFATLTINGANAVRWPSSVTNTMTTLTIAGTSLAAMCYNQSSTWATAATLSAGTANISWAVMNSITGAGAASPFSGTNSISLGTLTNITLSNPTAGAVGVIGG